jgi:hypothetical protein
MKLALSLAIAVLLAAPSRSGAQPANAAQDDPSLRGTVGVCIRWGGDPKHVADAVVVVPSGNPVLDRAIPDTVRAMTWDKPDGDYHGQWIGITLQVAGGSGDMPLPTCDAAKLPWLKPNT